LDFTGIWEEYLKAPVKGFAALAQGEEDGIKTQHFQFNHETLFLALLLLV
jgi:hypothetical protein